MEGPLTNAECRAIHSQEDVKVGKRVINNLAVLALLESGHHMGKHKKVEYTYEARICKLSTLSITEEA